MASIERLFVDRGGHQGLHFAFFQVGASAVERSLGGFVSLRRRDAERHRGGIGIAGNEVQPSVFRLLRVVNGVPLNITPLFAQRLYMLLRHHGVAVNHRLAQLKHMRLQQRLDNHFVSNAVRIAGCDCYCWFHFE